MIGPGAMPGSRSFPALMIVAPSMENQISLRERQKQAVGSVRGKEERIGEMRGERKGNTKTREKKPGEKERETYRAARLAGNYIAFVSDGAFNDLSSSKSL